MAKIREINPAPIHDGGPYTKSDDSIPVGNDPLGSAPPAYAKCLVNMQPDGKLAVSFLIDSTEAARIIRRAGNMDIGKYLWENILYRAVVDHVY